MSNFLKELIINKMKSLSQQEIIQYSKQYGFNISQAQAKDITTYLKSHSINPFESSDRAKMFRDLTQITDQETATKARKLFNEIIKSYGIDHLFN
ncbi:DUF2624 domain-containing protein [Virgibacillus byunsanensis]|uniref:DUF2624 domain-containing protein n=1 Tax=Virgibacillus byunsanensis TaxID=570945 RepID=A0ABW3LMM5_9BACI